MKNLLGKATLAAVAAMGIGGAALAQDDSIHLGYVLWDSEIASTHVVAAVLIDELGYDVELTSVDAGPMFTGLAQGDFDAVVAAWLPFTHEAYMDQFGDDFVDLGANLDGADLGWAVPTYVEVDSIADLNDYADQFGGEVIGIDPGAGLMAASERAFQDYDLSNFTLMDGSDAAMAAALDRAIDREEWIVVTSWRPHWMWAAYDLKYLEDPQGSLGESESIHTLVSTDFAENGPEDALNFLENFYWSGEDMGAVMLDIINDDMDPFDAARKWLDENQDTVASWLE